MAVQHSQVSQQHGNALQAWNRWRRVGLAIATLVLVAFILYMARGALFPFIISLVLAELLYPVVVFLENRLPGHDRMPGVTRIASILMIYVGFAATVSGILYLIIPPLFTESQEFIQTFPDVYERARSTVEGWSHDVTERVPVELRAQIEEAIAAGGGVLAEGARVTALRTVSGVSNAVTLVIGLVIVPFFLFFVLKDREQVADGIYSLMPDEGRVHTRNVILIINRVLGSYIRARVMSAAIIGVLVFIGLSILGIKFAAILGLVAGLFGLVPIIGPLLGAVPGLLLALASAPDRIIGVVLVYALVFVVENNLIGPRIQGGALRMNPAVIMIILVVSSEVAGLWGTVAGVPIAAASRDVFLYFQRQWATGVDGMHQPGVEGGKPEETPSGTTPPAEDSSDTECHSCP